SGTTAVYTTYLGRRPASATTRTGRRLLLRAAELHRLQVHRLLAGNHCGDDPLPADEQGVPARRGGRHAFRIHDLFDRQPNADARRLALDAAGERPLRLGASPPRAAERDTHDG